MKNNKIELLWYECGMNQVYERDCNHKFPYDIDGGGHPILESNNGVDWNKLTKKDKAKLKKYLELDYNGYAIDDGSGFYICGGCIKYLSLAEDICDLLNEKKMEMDFEYCVDVAYMLIDTYNSYKKIEEE